MFTEGSVRQLHCVIGALFHNIFLDILYRKTSAPITYCYWRTFLPPNLANAVP